VKGQRGFHSAWNFETLAHRQPLRSAHTTIDCCRFELIYFIGEKTMKNLKANKFFFGTLATFLVFALFLLFFFGIVRLQAQVLQPTEHVAVVKTVIDIPTGRILGKEIVKKEMLKVKAIGLKDVYLSELRKDAIIGLQSDLLDENKLSADLPDGSEQLLIALDGVKLRDLNVGELKQTQKVLLKDLLESVDGSSASLIAV
jgi:hypothetical protein